jgi:hypothetical protein
VDPSGGKIAVGVADGARVGDTKMQVGAHGGASLPVPPVLPPLRNGETAQLHDPKIENKETRPPPRYNEGTLIEVMQNAWRFVDVLRERLKKAKGIGTPATRAEIIGGLKKQGFLIAQGKHIVPTETGLSLFGVLEQADPALVDPGVTAQLECLLDDVVVGKQEMVGAIDAVCDVAQRIIGKLKESAAAGGPPLLGASVGNGASGYPPTPAMKRFADSLSRQKGIKPPPGYKTSISICRKFLSAHASRTADCETAGKLNPKPVRHSCCTPRTSRRGKASSSRMMRRPTGPRCPHGLTRTEARRATNMVPRQLTSRRGQLHFNRPRQRRGPESARVTPLLRHRLALCQNREKVLHCRYLHPLLARRMVCPNWESVFLHSSRGGG